MARAFEVLLGTGRGLAAWQSGGFAPAPWRFSALLLRPPRHELRAAAAARFDAMLRDGALDEARALLDRRLDPALPAMRAHGMPELVAFLAGRIGLAEARERAVAHTRQYIKRQDTWFRHHALTAPGMARHIDARFPSDEQFPERMLAESLAFLQSRR